MQAFMFRFHVPIRPPRHPLLRAVLALAGLGLLVFFAAFGVVIGALVLAAFGARRLLRNARRARFAQAAQPGVIDAEFSVVRKPHTLLPR